MNKLFIDIETSPNVVYAWDLYNTNIGINQVIEPTRIICVAFKADGEPMQFRSEWTDGHQAMVEYVHAAIDRTDAVVHYNGRAFDEKHLNREFLQAGLQPPSRPQTIDLYLTIKNRFRFAANRLAQVSKELEIGEKIKTDFDLWADVLAGDEKAQRDMERYNKKDVKLLEDLYDELLPWIDRHPNVALYVDDTERRCTRCGEAGLSDNGYRYTSAGKFKQYRCGNCGAQSRGSTRITTTPLREG